ncbi:MAG: carbon-nitrogen hydrolase family protein [Trueperaceae bacterium]|nr:carbon-nitrogen hydrolase family protein [Trueperaceae bacterium]
MIDAAPDVVRVAAVQATPVFLDLEATLDVACTRIEEAGRNGAQLAVFPEGFLPTYPSWSWFIPPYRTKELRELYDALWRQSVTVPGPAVERLRQAARAAGVAVVMGMNERNAEASGTTLYNSLLFIGSDGTLLGKHRKLVPTVAERLVHGQGDASGLTVYDLDIGRLGGLICWENYMPLARWALYAGGVQIYVAPTWDRGEPWISTLRHIAKEGRVFVIGCCSAVRRDDVPDAYGFKAALIPDMTWINPGGSAIIDPDGRFLVEPVMEREEILYANLDMGSLRGSRFQLDVAGHYGRPDLFDVTIQSNAPAMVRGGAPVVNGRSPRADLAADA